MTDQASIAVPADEFNKADVRVESGGTAPKEGDTNSGVLYAAEEKSAVDVGRSATQEQSFAISFENYRFAYAGTDDTVLQNVSFELPRGAFCVLCGLSGSGKSTLLRAMKPELAVAGDSGGHIRIMGQDPATFDPVTSACLVGFVQQDPENQLVTDTVWHELAFGLENIATEQETMRRRVAETAHFFGIGGWFDRKVSDLSGGQKQLLNLAAVVVMQPQVLVLDEPTSQLDPIAAKDFLDVLARVNAELGITVIIIEHRLEEVLPIADYVLFLSEGTPAYFGSSRGFIDYVLKKDLADKSGFKVALPAATRMAELFVAGANGAPAKAIASERVQGGAALAHAADDVTRGNGGEIPAKAAADDACGPKVARGELPQTMAAATLPVTVREGRAFLASQVRPTNVEARLRQSPQLLALQNKPQGEALLWCKDLWFRYNKEMPFVLRGVDFEVYAGQVAAIVGGNGSGKSTLLSALAGVRKPERGKVRKAGNAKVAMLTQDPKTIFVHDTLWDDLLEWREYGNYDEEAVEAILQQFGLARYKQRHPYDLSGGEIQKAALAKVLLLNPDVLLLDEPVKGIDAVAKAEVGRILQELASQGKAVLFTAHDLEFVAQIAKTSSMMFGCEITCTQDTHEFFQNNLFYSTATSRIARGLLDGCVTTEDIAYVINTCGDELLAGVDGCKG